MYRNKILHQSIESRDCISQNIDLARILAYYQNRVRIQIYPESQSYLSKSNIHFQASTRLATDNLLPSLCLYGSLRRSNNS